VIASAGFQFEVGAARVRFAACYKGSVKFVVFMCDVLYKCDAGRYSVRVELG